MKNKLSDLNDHLFEQLERLNDLSIKGDELTEEIVRARAISSIAERIIGNGSLLLKSHMADVEWESMSKKKLPLMLEG